ncbi:hypothetical protein NC652_005037 [Populus alba x Populus x berolinensis]|nr:hypothetical protein NC652_005037 [Populus alba x Populus x berolinensis]
MTERIVDTQKINNLIKLKPAGDLPGGAAVAPRRLGLGDRWEQEGTRGKRKEERFDRIVVIIGFTMLEMVLNDRLGKKLRVKCNDDDTIGDLNKLVAA